MRTQLLRSARVRFAATAATVFALVALGGVTASPASADVNAYIYVGDMSTGGYYANQTFDFGLLGGTGSPVTTDANGGFTFGPGQPDGDYVITGLPPKYYAGYVALNASSTVTTIYIDTYKFNGTIPADAANGETTVDIEQLVGSTWTVVDTQTVTSTTGAFQFTAPGGIADYRLRFYPSANTPYAETLTPSFFVNGYNASADIGAVTLDINPTISGTVTDSYTLLPVVGATVHAAVGGTDVATAVTDSSGDYVLHPGAGDADYEVWVEAPLYADQQWSGGVALNATDGYVHGGIDFVLEAQRVTLTGSILNAAGFGDEVTIELYSGGSSMPVLLDSTTMSRDPWTFGEYSIPDVAVTGTYFLKVVPSGNDAFLPTLLGAAGAQEWADSTSTESDFSLNDSFTVDPSVPSSLVHSATIEQGSLLRGYLTSYGSPISGCVTLEDVNDPSIYYCATPDSSGYWQIRLRTGGTYELYAGDGWSAHISEWWNDAVDRADATPVGPLTAGYFGEFNFDLAPIPATVYAYAEDVAATDPITVHLYFRDGGGVWREVGSGDTDPAAAYIPVEFIENYYTGDPDGLASGDYRVRFQNSSGTWLAATEYITGVLPTYYGPTQTGPACVIELTDVEPGKLSFVEATFDVANQTEVCGPEPLSYGDVEGDVVTSSTYGDAPVAFHYVELYNDDRDYYASTDVDGAFTIDNAANGDYTLDIYPGFHVWGEHEYRYTQDLTLTGGNVDIGTLVATRLGNAYGQISNWDDATMDGATATVARLVTDPAGDYWQPGPVDVEITSTGEFEVPGIDTDGQYGVFITFPDTWSPVFIGGGLLEPTSPFTGIAEQDYNLGSVSLELTEMVTISGTVFFGTVPAAGTVVMAHPVGTCSCMTFGGPVDLDGTYSFEVVPGADYEVIAFNPFTQMQVYSGYNYPLGYTGAYSSTPVFAGSGGATGINFSLIASEEVTFDTLTFAWDEATDTTDYLEDVQVHLYQKVGEGWAEVDSEISDPYAMVEGLGSNDYRLRFEYNGDWLAVHEVESWLYYPYADDVDWADELDPAQCYYDFESVEQGTYIETDITLVEDSSSYSCGPETALVYDVAGNAVQTANAGGSTIENQQVTLTSQASGTVYPASTDSNGEFYFADIAVGDYTLSFVPGPTADGHTYMARDETVQVTGDADLGDFELTRYGNLEVQIANYNAATMSGTTGQVYQDLGSGWVATGLEATVDSGTGLIVIPGVTDDGTYTAYLDYPAGFVDGFLSDMTGAVTSATGYAEYDITGLDTYAFTTISGLVRMGAAAVPSADVTAENLWGDVYASTSTSSGSYIVQVPAGYTYTVGATKTGLVASDSVSSVTVGFAPVSAIVLEMHYATFTAQVFDSVPTVLPSATMHLYRQVTGGWQEVATATGSLPSAWTNLSGSYRIRISDGGDWLPLARYQWFNTENLSENSGGTVDPTPDVCFVDIAPASGGARYQVNIEVALVSSVMCAAEPEPVAPPVTPGTTGSGTKKPVTAGTAPTAEVAPTSTPTPAPEPSETAVDQPDDEPTVDAPATASSPDLAWLFWVAGILALLILAGGAVYVIRRR